MRKYTLPLLIIISAGAFFMFGKQADRRSSLNHIALYVYDLNRSTDFYTQLIGLEKIEEPFHDGKHTWFRLTEHSQFHLISGAKQNIAHDKNSHICFSVVLVDDFTQLLKQKNIAYENWAGDKGAVTTRTDGVHQIYFQDPDGNWIEVNDDKY